MNEYSFLRKFQNGEIITGEFNHREHVQAAWEMLKTYPFMEAVVRYAGCIESMACKAGAPEKFNMTITLSFMSLIAERMASAPESDFDGFYTAHPDLVHNPLRNWYSDQRLNNDLARRIFLMPESRTA